MPSGRVTALARDPRTYHASVKVRAHARALHATYLPKDAGVADAVLEIRTQLALERRIDERGHAAAGLVAGLDRLVDGRDQLQALAALQAGHQLLVAAGDAAQHVLGLDNGLFGLMRVATWSFWGWNEEAAASIKVPTLILQSIDDPREKAGGEELAKRIPNSDYVRLKGGHFLLRQENKVRFEIAQFILANE